MSFLNRNDIFSSGSSFSLILNQKAENGSLLLNNSIQNWSYIHLKHGFGSGLENKSGSLLLKTSFSSSNVSRGLYQGLTLESIQSASDRVFLLSSNIRRQIGTDYLPAYCVISILLILLEIAYILNYLHNNINLKANFGYCSARLLTLIHICNKWIKENLVGPLILEIASIQFVEIMMIMMAGGVIFYKIATPNDFKEILWKKVPVILFSEVLLILLSLDLAYYPMVIFVPLLVAWIDRLQSRGCQRIQFLLLSEIIKFVITLIGCYCPYYIIPFQQTLLMGFDYCNLGLFIFVGFILLPTLFYLQLKFSSKPIKEAKIILFREELHGKNNRCPSLIQEGQGDILLTKYRIGWVQLPHLYSNKKVLFYYSSSTRGVIEVEVKQFEILNGRRKFLVSTGFINFYIYKSQTNLLAQSSPQHCQDLGYKPSFRIRVMKRNHLQLFLYLIPVETPEATNEQKFFAIIMESHGKH